MAQARGEKTITAVASTSSPRVPSKRKMVSRQRVDAGRLLDSGRLSRGRSDARKGQVLSVDVIKDGIAVIIWEDRQT